MIQKSTEEISGNGNLDFWIPYSDLMAGLLGVFILLLIVSLYHLGAPLEKVKDILQNRKIVIDNLQKELAKSDAEITETGAIRFSGEILFDVDSSKLREDGKRILSKTMPQYLDKLFRIAEFKKHLDKIYIVGHADKSFKKKNNGERNDPESAYKYNLELSQKRAFSVLNFLLNDPGMDKYKKNFKKYVIASGRSFMDPVIKDNKINNNLSRRIEIYFKMNDEGILKKLLQEIYLNE